MGIKETIDKIVNSLKLIRGVEAVVLGGSRARGNFTEKSDIDIGIYYRDSLLLDLDGFSRTATELDDDHRLNLITQIGEWGPWINGGGWLTIDGVPTDFLLRDIRKVSTVIDDCLNEKITIDYQPGHPHGFVNAIYLAETFYCKILWTSSDYLSILKEKITPYPISLKRGVINKFLWEAGFFSGIAKKSLSKNDVTYTLGCLYRVVSCLIQVIYALNDTYLMNEKGALAISDTFNIVPRELRKRIESVICSLTVNTENMKDLINELISIVQEVEALC